MTGRVTGHKNGVNVIVGDDRCVYFNYGKPLSYGTEVCFDESAYDPEVADSVRPIRDNNYSVRELIAAMIIGLIIGATLSFMTASRVYGAPLSDTDKSLLVQVVHAEAGNQDLLGRRLVADAVLNRVDHEDFPDTVKGVIYQKGQFQAVSNGSINLQPDEMDYMAVEMELNERTSDTVLFFRRGRYSEFGSPLYKIGDHYFS